ncbi:epigen [Amphiprion ocellaris]|uniref:EGF-like domain-containing protein n=1 Tax=Amphiprion ocellaris TaxID=80972 RepID=A0A3Q1BZI1_AMPOC|nr:epigen [Amphiprion ocellaris]
MFTQRQTYLEKALLFAVLLLVTSAGQSAVLTDNLQTTATPPPPPPPPPPPTDSPLTTQLSNSSVEGPRVQFLHTPCGSDHDNFCSNGGQCVFPQDSVDPFCICTTSYSGHRCMLFTGETYILPENEQLIAIGFGVIMLIFFLAILIYCIALKRCRKSAPLIKSAPSEISV